MEWTGRNQRRLYSMGNSLSRGLLHIIRYLPSISYGRYRIVSYRHDTTRHTHTLWTILGTSIMTEIWYETHRCLEMFCIFSLEFIPLPWIQDMHLYYLFFRNIVMNFKHTKQSYTYLRQDKEYVHTYIDKNG